MGQDLYNNRNFIPDFNELMAETAARSHELAARVEAKTDVAYGAGARERMDIIFPADRTGNVPIHMFIHGGYWRAGNKNDCWLMAAPALQAGAIAVIVGYDLMPGARLGHIVQQIRAAAMHVYNLCPELGADRKRLTVSGHSAGAHLASYLAAYGPQETEGTLAALPQIQGMLLISGIYDLTDIPNSFLKEETRMTAAEAAAWSPLTSRQLAGPQRIVMVSEHDSPPFHQQGRQFATMLEDSVGNTQYRVEPGLNHLSIVLQLSDPSSPSGQCLVELIEN